LDTKLAHAEFAYNQAPSYATSHFSFEVYYDLDTLTPIDLIPSPQESKVSFDIKVMAKGMKRLHEQVRGQIEKVNKQYKLKANMNHTHLEFQPRDLVCLHLKKERFPLRMKNKLMARGDGPYKVVPKVGENAYEIELLGDMQISTTFNVRNLTPYIEEEDEHNEDLRDGAKSQGLIYSSKKGL